MSERVLRGAIVNELWVAFAHARDLTNARLRAAGVDPAEYGFLSIVGTLQAGNAHLLFIAAAVAAMLLFERQRHAAGGAILAYAIVSKLFPGVLLFYLLLRRDWRAVGWTAAWSVALVAVMCVMVYLQSTAALDWMVP